MILIADSGSTKTEWRIAGAKNDNGFYFSSGINPYFQNSGQILAILKEEIPELEGMSFNKVFFYGTGCNSESKEKVISDALNEFLNAEEIFVGSDLLGAARALCNHNPGIACIIGTGSNSCYYDGEKIVSNVAPLGYILGDEGGAAVLGRKLVSSVLKNQISPTVISRFYETYHITRNEILENVYTKPFPNRYLGNFARFIYDNIALPELQEIVMTSFDEFIKRNIMQYPESAKYPVHFTGSVAFYFKTYLEDLLHRNNLLPGKIILYPMPELIKYHFSD